MTATAAVLAAAVVTSCEAKVYGTPPEYSTEAQITVVSPHGSLAALPQASPDHGSVAFDGLEVRARQATNNAAKDGATISAAILDRHTGQTVSNGNETSELAIASVAKLFIADDLLLQESKGQTQLTTADRRALDDMLRSSDDDAAENFWNRDGNTAIIARVTARYGLKATFPPVDGHWWNTVSTAADLVHYYDMLLDGSGGLPADKANFIISNLAQATPTGIDGYPQRFGIPDALSGEWVAVKQGWMCCIGRDWMHLSTGVIGVDRRFVLAISSMQSSDDDEARSTITDAVKTMFPGGRI
jgi:hypothetical protein